VAVINAFDLNQGRAAREALRAHFLGAEPAVNINAEATVSGPAVAA
jgi:hypothetical protein